MSEPQPIETAPDRQHVLLWMQDWQENRKGYWFWARGMRDGSQCYYMHHPVYHNGKVKVEATHWLPLPTRLFGTD